MKGNETLCTGYTYLAYRVCIFVFTIRYSNHYVSKFMLRKGRAEFKGFKRGSKLKEFLVNLFFYVIVVQCDMTNSQSDSVYEMHGSVVHSSMLSPKHILVHLNSSGEDSL